MFVVCPMISLFVLTSRATFPTVWSFGSNLQGQTGHPDKVDHIRQPKLLSGEVIEKRQGKIQVELKNASGIVADELFRSVLI